MPQSLCVFVRVYECLCNVSMCVCVGECVKWVVLSVSDPELSVSFRLSALPDINVRHKTNHQPKLCEGDPPLLWS